MKFLRLDLLAFGRFTGRSLEFPENGPGLHLLCGANEQGKSTALAALVNLLYGIDPRSPFDFIHDYKRMRIGAEIIADDGGKFAFQRKKGNKDTLRDEAGQPLPDSLLDPLLGRVDQTFFEGMFGLDHSRLRQGGEEILLARGEVGASLFQSGAAIIGLHQAQERLDAESHGLFAPSASNPPINQVLSKLKEIRHSQSEATLKVEAWKKLEAEAAESQKAQQEIGDTLRALQQERVRLERIRRVLPLLAKHRELNDRLDALSGSADLPPEAPQQRRDAEQKLLLATENLNALESTLAELKAAQREASPLLPVAARIDGLQRRRGAMEKAARDLPLHHDRVRTIDGAIDRNWRSIGREIIADQSAEALPKATDIATISDLHDKGRDLRLLIDQAEEAVTSAQAKLDRLAEDIRELPTAVDASPLRALVDEVRGLGNLEATADRTANAAKEHGRRLATLLAGSPLWRGKAEDLAGLPVPSISLVRQRQSDRQRLDNRLQQLLAGQADLATALRQRDDELEVLRAEGVVPTPEAVTEARGLRDRRWRLVRRVFVEKAGTESGANLQDGGQPLPDAYESSVSAADQLADRRDAEAARIARFQENRAQRTITRQKLDKLALEIDGLQADLLSWDASWRNDWAPSAIIPASPAEMLDWLVLRGKALDLQEALATAAGDHHLASQAVIRALAALAEGLAGFGEGSDIVSLETLAARMARAAAVLAKADAAAAHRTALNERLAAARQTLADAQNHSRTLAQRQSQWRRLWQTAAAPLALGAEPGLAEVGAALAVIETIAAQLRERDGLWQRIRDMQADADDFAREVADLVGEVAPDLAAVAALEATDTLFKRLADARTQASLQEQADGRRQDLMARRDKADGQRQEAVATIERLRLQAGCAAAAEIEDVETRSASRRRLLADIEDVEDAIRTAADGRTVPEITAEASQEEADLLDVRAQQIDLDIAGLNERAAEVGGQVRLLAERFRSLGGGDAARAAQDAENLTARLQQDSERFIILKMASVLLRRALEDYRRRHEGPLLALASVLFERLTGGSFSRLATDFDEKNRPVLQGHRPDGEILEVEGMSEGTRDQLFLALRLAAVEHFLQGHEKIPFIADDLLIHFDDERASMALQTLADLATRTQVLFFTHNNHMVELARRRLPAGSFLEHAL